MTTTQPQCQDLTTQVNQIIQLVQKNSELRAHVETAQLETSLQKAVAPKFEIVFAGAFSAGKSMLINALLERELLYSAEGHATGTECYIEYSPPEAERVVLTFLSESEIRMQVATLTKLLNLKLDDININQSPIIQGIKAKCAEIIAQEGGYNKSETGKQANALFLLLDGFESNRDKIHTTQNATYSMDQFNFTNLSEAATYARRGKNSAVLKRLDYFCFHPLLEDGNVLVDLPGIDAPIKKDADLAYRKIEDPNTSAVICVLKPASAGDLTQAETDLLDKLKNNSAIRDRVFYVFNRIDQTWYNAQLRQRLDGLINSEFSHTSRIYKTSGLLGFYGSQIRHSSSADRFGLNTFFADSIKSMGGEEDTPQFISEFNNYCANSGKLTRTDFKVSVHGYDSPNENYVRILNEWGQPLIEQLIEDSGINSFKEEITRYLREEKRPQLFKNLAEDLQPICITLKKYYQQEIIELENQPQEIEAMKKQKLSELNQQLQEIGNNYYNYIDNHVNAIVTNDNKVFDRDFQLLQNRFVTYLDELLNNFSVEETHRLAVKSHPRNTTTPLIAILVEALYYLSNELEDLLKRELETLVNSFVDNLVFDVRQQDIYRQLYHLLGDDGGIEADFIVLKEQLLITLQNEASVECDRYVRESPQFYSEGTFSIYQFRETLKQTSQAYDISSLVESEPAIRQLLRLDFESKVNRTIKQFFRQTVNQSIKTQLLPMAKTKADNILQKYDIARDNLKQTLEQESKEKIAYNQQLTTNFKDDCQLYNQSIQGINNCLEAMQVYNIQLPLITLFQEVKNMENSEEVSV